MKRKNYKKNIFRRSKTIAFFVLSFLGYFSFTSPALALLGDYNKPVQGILSASEWNLLATDFLPQSGGNIIGGRLGIGTTLPNINSLLHIFNTSGNAEFDLQSVSGANNHWGIYNKAGDNSFNIWGGDDYLTILRNGNIGLGTTSPSAKLHLGSGGIKFSDGSYQVTAFSGASQQLNARNISSGEFGADAGGGNYYFAATTLGNVGIGTTSPVSKLHVSGDIIYNSRAMFKIGSSNNNIARWAKFATISIDKTWENDRYEYYIKSRNFAGTLIISTYSGNPVETNDIRLFKFNFDYNLSASPRFVYYKSSDTTYDIYVYLPGYTSMYYSALYDNQNGTGWNVGSVSYYLNEYADPSTGYVEATYATNGLWGASGSNIFSMNSGNMGVGTSTPTAKLEVVGNLKTTSATVSAIGSGIVMSDSSGNLYATSTISSTEFVRSVFVGATTATYNGNNSGNPGYDYAYARCEAEYPKSHVCTPDDMLSTVQSGALFPTTNVWIFSGPPGYTASANDCNGRRGTGSNDLGTYWEGLSSTFPKGRGLLLACNQAIKIACCR